MYAKGSDFFSAIYLYTSDVTLNPLVYIIYEKY